MKSKITKGIISLILTIATIFCWVMVMIAIIRNEKQLRLDEWIVEGIMAGVCMTVAVYLLLKQIYNDNFKNQQNEDSGS